MAEAHKDDEHCQVAEPAPFQSAQPSERFFVQNNPVLKRVRRNLERNMEESDHAPDNENYDHHCSDGHYLHRFLAGLVHALGVFPPEIKCDEYSENSGERVLGKMAQRMPSIARCVFDEAG